MPVAPNPTECCISTDDCPCCPEGTPATISCTLPTLTDITCVFCAGLSGQMVELLQSGDCQWQRVEFFPECDTFATLAARVEIGCDDEFVDVDLFVLSRFNSSHEKRWTKTFPIEEFDCLNFSISYGAGDITNDVGGGFCEIGDTASIAS